MQSSEDEDKDNIDQQSEELNESPPIAHKKIPKIRVVVRKRPANVKELQQNDIDIIQIEKENTVIVKELKSKVDLTKYIEEHRYIFDRAFGEASTNEQIYKEIVYPMIQAAFNQTKITCFAYGQTGSGKTFTMMGNNDSNKKVPGLYYLSAIDVFNYLKKEEYSNLEIWISFYEIYCNKLFDLLNNKNVLQAREDGKGNICIVGLEEKPVHNLKELMQMIDFGLSSRTTGITGANCDSSRSHAIMQLNIKRKTNLSVYSKISFIDLAGSERAVDTIDTNKQTKIDGAEINKSLLALKECIRALDQEKRHTPFRGSKLTLVLRDSFIGNCLTMMIANISPCLSCSEHTLNTLRYADRVKELRRPRNEKDNYYGVNVASGKDPNEALANLLMMPRQHNKTVKYNLDVKMGKNNSGGENANAHEGAKPNTCVSPGEITHINELIKKGNIMSKRENNNKNSCNINMNGKNPPKYKFSAKNAIHDNYNININGNSSDSPDRVDSLDHNQIKKQQYNFKRKKSNNNVSSFAKNQLANKQQKQINNANIFNYNLQDIENYKSKYEDANIDTDEDFQKLSNIHEDLINNIIKEEDEFISFHEGFVDETVELVKTQLGFIDEVKKPGSDLESYTYQVDKLLFEHMKKIQRVRERLNKFRIMLKDETALSNKFDEDFHNVDDTNNSDNNNNNNDSNNMKGYENIEIHL